MAEPESGPVPINLPIELTSFVGRREEVGAIRRLLGTTRLLSLVGPGGVGKTRLAIKTARDVARHYPDGVAFVELAEIQDPSLVTLAVFTALGLQDRTAGWSVAGLADYLAEKRLLLVLDNCEHVLDATAVLAGTLLRACPELAVLATSRQALGVTGEVVDKVRPLSMPDPSDDSVASLTRSDAVTLFVERAIALQPDFTVDAGNAKALLELCRRLDGVPLALELAALRLNALGLEALASGLTDRLGTGDRSRPKRQQTLDATIDWSYQLLTGPERLLWSRLSVFTGGFELDAAQLVCSDKELAKKQLPLVLAALVEKSLVGRELRGGRERFRILVTLRAFGRERLKESGTDRVFRLRHAEWIAGLAAEVAEQGDRLVEQFARLRTERANVWAALDFCLEDKAEAQRGIAICRSLFVFWLTEGHFSEVINILAAFLDRVPIPNRPRAEALWVSAFLCASKSDFALGRRLAGEALEIGRSISDADVVAWALMALATASWVEGRSTEAIDHSIESLHLTRTMGLHMQTLTGLNLLGLSQVFADQIGPAVATGLEAIALSQKLGETWLRGDALYVLAIATLRDGRSDEAEGLARQGVTLRRDLGHVSEIASLAEVLAYVEIARGHNERATTLLGGADAVWRSVSWTQYRYRLPEHEKVRADARLQLGDARFQAALDAGLAMSRDEVADYALGHLVPTKAHHTRESTKELAGLSRREMEVARLVADGATNAQTAGQLFISERTVESHVTNIFNKLGVDSRVQVARWVASLEALAEA